MNVDSNDAEQQSIFQHLRVYSTNINRRHYLPYWICTIIVVFKLVIILKQTFTRFWEKLATQGRCHLYPDMTCDRLSYLQNKGSMFKSSGSFKCYLINDLSDIHLELQPVYFTVNLKFSSKPSFKTFYVRARWRNWGASGGMRRLLGFCTSRNISNIINCSNRRVSLAIRERALKTSFVCRKFTDRGTSMDLSNMRKSYKSDQEVRLNLMGFWTYVFMISDLVHMWWRCTGHKSWFLQ